MGFGFRSLTVLSLKYPQARSKPQAVFHSQFRTWATQRDLGQPWTCRAKTPQRGQTPDAGQRVWCPGWQETAPGKGCSIRGRGRRGPSTSPDVKVAEAAEEAGGTVTLPPISHWGAGPLILPTAQGDRDQSQTPPPTPILLPFSRVGTTGVIPRSAILSSPLKGR